MRNNKQATSPALVISEEKAQLLGDFQEALEAKDAADERFSALAFDLITEWTIEANCSAHDILRAVQRHLDMEHDDGGFDAGSGCLTCAAPHPVIKHSGEDAQQHLADLRASLPDEAAVQRHLDKEEGFGATLDPALLDKD